MPSNWKSCDIAHVQVELFVNNLNCRTHDINNLYVVDGSFFPSNSGVNTTLTIIANALRVGCHLVRQLN